MDFDIKRGLFLLLKRDLLVGVALMWVLPALSQRNEDAEFLFANKDNVETINGLTVRWDSCVTDMQIRVLRRLIKNMVTIDGGTFRMGGDDSVAFDDEYPIHSVTLPSYLINKYEVTQKEWSVVVDSNSSYFKGVNLPVEGITMDECNRFIQKLNKLTGLSFRLPTEAEWEFAARGGNSSQGYKYSGSDNIDDVAWYGDNSGEQTHRVGKKMANELGLYDMSGNVYEWCSDWYQRDYYAVSPGNNPKGPDSGTYRVLRGGSWFNYSWCCRVAFRDGAPLNSTGNIGLRLAL